MPNRPAAPARLGSLALRLVLVSLLAASAGCLGGVEERLAELRALQDAGRFHESIEPLRALVAEDPQLAEAHYLLGVALVQTGQPSLAIYPLQKAATAPEQQVAAGLVLASTFAQLEAWEEAIAAADAVLAADPKRLAALRVRALARLGAKHREEALADAQRLREAEPDDFQTGLLHATVLAELDRHEEAEAAYAALETEAADDPETAARACLARASFFEDDLGDDARAEAHYRRCLEHAPANPLVLRFVTGFLDERDRRSEATEIWRRALTEEPASHGVRQLLASRLAAAGDVDGARALLRENIEQGEGAAGWAALAEFEQRQQRTEAALAALDEAEKLLPRRDEKILFLKGDLLVDKGRLDEAEALLSGFEEASYRELLRGRILLERGDPRAALEALEAGLRRWPNNAGGRYLAGLAARELGDVERAVSELRESVRADAAATDAALVLATLEASRGAHRDALDAARLFTQRRGSARPEGYQLAIRAQSALGLPDAARRTVVQLRDAGFPMEAAIAGAEVDGTAAGGGTVGAAAAVASLQASGLDATEPSHEPLLRALAEALLGAGRGDAALAAVDRALARDTGRASLHELRGTVLLRLDRRDDAEAAFDEALARDAADARARAGLGAVAYARGDLDAALARYDEASAARPEQVAPAYAAAQIALARGDRSGARRRLEEVVRRQPGHADARNDLAWLLALAGEDLDRALALAEGAQRIAPGPEVDDTLGFVHLQRGDAALAVELFERALAALPDAQSIRFRLGLALARQGEREHAADALRAALAPGEFPEAEAARSELARLEAP